MLIALINIYSVNRSIQVHLLGIYPYLKVRKKERYFTFLSIGLFQSVSFKDAVQIPNKDKLR